LGYKFNSFFGLRKKARGDYGSKHNTELLKQEHGVAKAKAAETEKVSEKRKTKKNTKSSNRGETTQVRKICRIENESNKKS
jgi:hypothetical protein